MRAKPSIHCQLGTHIHRIPEQHYGRPMFLWVERLEENKDMIVAWWGEKLFRTCDICGVALRLFPTCCKSTMWWRGTVPRRGPNPLRRWLAWVDRRRSR